MVFRVLATKSPNEIKNSIAMRNFVSSHLDHCFCKYSKMPQNTSVTIVWRITSFTMRNTITEDKLTNTFASGDKTTGDAPTARTGLAHRITMDSVAHWWVRARTPTEHQCLYGGRPWVARDTVHAAPPQRQDQGYHATPWLPTVSFILTLPPVSIAVQPPTLPSARHATDPKTTNNITKIGDL